MKLIYPKKFIIPNYQIINYDITNLETLNWSTVISLLSACKFNGKINILTPFNTYVYEYKKGIFKLVTQVDKPVSA